MKTLSQLIKEAEERFEKEFPRRLLESENYDDETENIKDFLKTELTNIVKESFKNTETVGEDHKLEITKQGEIDTSKTHWATYGYRAALSDTKIKQNQFLNN